MIDSLCELTSEKDHWRETFEVSENEKLSLVVKVSELGEKLSLMSRENDDLTENMLKVSIYEFKGNGESSSLQLELEERLKHSKKLLATSLDRNS